MKKIGRSMRIGKILPVSERALTTTRLARGAKLRLSWFDYYNKTGSAALTCRHFGIARSTFYKWKRRYLPNNLLSLENRSRAPRRQRKPTTSIEIVGLIRILRMKNPEYSKYKLAVILKRDFGLITSASTVGRIIARYQLPRALKNRRPKQNKSARPRTLKPKNLVATGINQIYEFDTKHLPSFAGRKSYAFVTIETFSKQTSITLSSSISSKQASLALKIAFKRLGRPKIVITDNGSENFKSFQKELQKSSTTHFFTRVRTPKDKAFVERMIGSLETECLAQGGLVGTIPEQQRLINRWLAKYHCYRPHAALNYLTPHEFLVKIKEAKVSAML